MNEQEEIQKYIDQVKKIEKNEKVDLSSGEDLSVAIMNLLGIEEHLFFTGAKTNKGDYLELLNKVREMRKELMKRIVKNPEGETWCTSKHFLSASMRLMEVGTKALGMGNSSEAQEMFRKSYELYNMFWGLNLGIIKTEDLKSGDDQKIHLISEDKEPKLKSEVGIFEKLGQIIKRAVDCCKE